MSIEKRMSFIQFMVWYWKDEFRLDIGEDQAKCFVLNWTGTLLGQDQYKGKHCGDCTKECQTCELCMYLHIQDQYYNYTKEWLTNNLK